MKRSASDAALVDDASHSDDATIKWVITSSAVPIIIGKGGSTVKQVSAQSGANIKVTSSDPKANGIPVVVISGSLEGKLAALCQLRVLLAQATPKGQDINPPLQIYLPETYIGVVLGKRGAADRFPHARCWFTPAAVLQ